jgi:tRNA-2-methylthio-N6-dimethylallyladenosine synthase
MKQYHVWTIGCQMNKADSEFIAGYLERAGLRQTVIAEEADFVLLNSCVVREHAEVKVVNKLRSLKGLKKSRPDVTIALTGCMVDSRIDDLKDRFPWVDLFFRPQQWDVFSKWAESHGLPSLSQGEASVPQNPPVSAYVPIIHGCDSFCSYCVVPYRRGRARSRDLDEICCQVQSLVQRGTKEVVLLGQIVDAYGDDLASKPDLADLLAELNRIKGLLRIRFLTSHPSYMSHKLIQAIADLDKVCEHISLPIQAGDNDILKAMKRGYTAEEYGHLVDDMRRIIPDVAISTDMIVGFPGETDEQFARTLEALRQTRFDKVHIAAYSPRPETIATRNLRDDVTPETKETRRAQAEALQNAIAAEINDCFLGKTAEVLVEDQKKGKWCGRTRGDKLVFFSSEASLVGQLASVKIEKTSAFALQGTLA